MATAHSVLVHAQGASYTASVLAEGTGVHIGVVRNVGAHARRAPWWIAHVPSPHCAPSAAGAGDAAAAWAERVVEHWAGVSLALSEPDTPDEDAEGDAPEEVCTVRVPLPTPLVVQVSPASERASSVYAARLVHALTEHTQRQVAALEAAVRASHAALDAERAKYRELLAAHPPSTARYAAASIVHPGRIRYVAHTDAAARRTWADSKAIRDVFSPTLWHGRLRLPRLVALSPQLLHLGL